MKCKDIVESVTHFMDGALPAEARIRFERHLTGCEGCRHYLQQMQGVSRALAGLAEDEPPSASQRESLLRMFREHARADGAGAVTSVRLGIGDQAATLGDHIAYFWENESEFATGVNFLELGLRGRDACFIFGHPEANEKVLDLLWKRGMDTEGLRRDRRLFVLGGGPRGDAMLAEIGAAFTAARDAGAPVLRLLGNIGWGRANWPRDNEILEFEAKVTEAARQFPCVVVCMYDVCALPGRILLRGGFETHPLTVRCSELRENPHYVPTEKFLAQLSGRGSERVQ
jgi:hypothetical protein